MMRSVCATWPADTKGNADALEPTIPITRANNAVLTIAEPPNAAVPIHTAFRDYRPEAIGVTEEGLTTLIEQTPI